MASTTLQSYEQLSYASPKLSQHSAQARVLIGDGAATRTLTIRESGALAQFDLAAGVVYTLPAPVVGATFEFVTTVSCTSNSHKIITNSASVFLLGEVFMYTTATASGAGFAFNGTTHVACTSNGTTTGGLIGSVIRVVAISATQWMITGAMVGSGTIVTPAATS